MEFEVGHEFDIWMDNAGHLSATGLLMGETAFLAAAAREGYATFHFPDAPVQLRVISARGKRAKVIFACPVPEYWSTRQFPHLVERARQRLPG
jgi:hypothetical protein